MDFLVSSEGEIAVLADRLTGASILWAEADKIRAEIG
jgi:hypothetical protein